MIKKECIAMLLAGGQGNRMKDLTSKIAKPAVSFAGKYRIIDFSLSNCVNSKIDTVGVLIQYRPLLLSRYIGTGDAWDLDVSDGGIHLLPPYYTQEGGQWYKGTADSIYHNIDFISSFNPEYVLILSGDHLYKFNYNDMLLAHKANKADLTISVLQVPLEEAKRFGIMSVDENSRITEFEEKPKNPKSDLASMGIYIFTWKKLKKILMQDHEDPNSENDFGKNIIPRLLAEKANVFAYRFSGYWKDIGTIDSYYSAHMDLLKEIPGFNLYDENFKIYSSTSSLYPAHRIGKNASVSNSMICNGAKIDGFVENSVIGLGAVVEKGAYVKDCILLPDCKIKANSKVIHSIVNEEAVMDENTIFGTDDEVKIFSGNGGQK